MTRPFQGKIAIDVPAAQQLAGTWIVGADDNAVRAHPKSVLDQITLENRSRTRRVGWTGFKPHHVLLLQLKFGGIFDGHDPLARID